MLDILLHFSVAILLFNLAIIMRVRHTLSGSCHGLVVAEHVETFPFPRLWIVGMRGKVEARDVCLVYSPIPIVTGYEFQIRYISRSLGLGVASPL